MPAILLDRDGVINEDSREYIKTLSEWEPIPGSLEAIARLSIAGWTIAVCTNQSGLARGLVEPQALDAIHNALRAGVERLGGQIHGIYWCPHGPDDGCECRKPRPGLLRQAERALGLDLSQAVFVGDSERDLSAARAVGARPILVRTGNGRNTERAGRAGDALVFDGLAAVADWLLTPTDRGC